MSSSSQQLAEGSSEQAASIEETSSSLEEMSSMTKQNAENAGQADSASKVGELVAEIAAASSEQAQGIEQVNTTVTEMDKVTQSNAANAEESASASEEMSAQAEEMKKMVGDLVVLIEGQANGNGREASTGVPVSQSRILSSGVARPTRAPSKALAANPSKEVTPEQLIPLGDNDFKDF